MTLRQKVKTQFYSLQRRISRRRAGPVPRRQADRLVIFAMHAINDARSDMAVSPGRFREQLESLLDAGYRPLAMDDVLDVLSGRKSSPAAFAITFDDGYESVYTQALPILESLSIPATVFLTTGFLDGTVSPPWRSSNAAVTRRISQPGREIQTHELGSSAHPGPSSSHPLRQPLSFPSSARNTAGRVGARRTDLQQSDSCRATGRSAGSVRLSLWSSPVWRLLGGDRKAGVQMRL